MKRIACLFIIIVTMVFQTYSQSYKNLWTSSEYLSGISHDMMLVYNYDDFENKKFYSFTDIIKNVKTDIDLVFFHFHWLENTGLSGITVTVNSKNWYFLTGKVAIKIDNEIIRLEGKASSKNDFPTLQTKVFIWGLPNEFIEKIKGLNESSHILLRIYTKEKGYIDIDMPIKFFQEAADMTMEKMLILKQNNGVK